MHGHRPGTYGAAFADVYDDWYADVSDVPGTVATVSALAAGGPVLELGVGTGRLALPLVAAGVDVVGLDASPEMLERLGAKPEGSTVTAVCADMVAPPFPDRSFSVALVAFNTFFNLDTDDSQRRCLTETRRVLRPGGALVIEAFAPPEGGLTDGGVAVRDLTVDTAVLTVSLHDETAQTVSGHHVEIRESGIRMRPWMVRYLTPEQLDERAADAGFALESRHADWAGRAFVEGESANHVSVYRSTEAEPGPTRTSTARSGG